MADGSTTEDPLALAPPAQGRRYGHRRRVQLGDVTPSGRMRLDAVARFLQDVSDEDTSDAALEAGTGEGDAWVVRRVLVRVVRFPVFREQLDVVTWCSGTGARWAERRVSMPGVEAAVLWVHLDRSGRPKPLPEHFHHLYGEACGGRAVRPKLHHDAVPAGPAGAPWPLRFTDVDLMGHVNNAAAWEAVEEELAGRPVLRAPLRVSAEHPASLEREPDVSRVVADAGGGFDLWLVQGGTTCFSAQVRPDQAGATVR